MDNDEVGMNSAYRHYGCLWQGVVGNDKIGITTPKKKYFAIFSFFQDGRKKHQLTVGVYGKSTHEDQTFFPVNSKLLQLLPHTGAGGRHYINIRRNLCQV